MGLIEYEAQRNTVLRLFGSSAVLGGTLGTPSHPGRLEITLDGTQIGVGPNFQAAIQAASRHLATGTRKCPEISAKS